MMSDNSYYAGEDIEPPDQKDFKMLTFASLGKTLSKEDIKELFQEIEPFKSGGNVLSEQLKKALQENSITWKEEYDLTAYEKAKHTFDEELIKRHKQFRDDLIDHTEGVSYEALRCLYSHIEKGIGKDVPKDRVYFYLFRIEFKKLLDLFHNLTMWNRKINDESL